MSDEDSCGKSMCRKVGGCIFASIWDIIICPFISCFKCVKYTYNKCCCKCCCKKNQSPKQV